MLDPPWRFWGVAQHPFDRICELFGIRRHGIFDTASRNSSRRTHLGGRWWLGVKLGMTIHRLLIWGEQRLFRGGVVELPALIFAWEWRGPGHPSKPRDGTLSPVHVMPLFLAYLNSRAESAHHPRLGFGASPIGVRPLKLRVIIFQASASRLEYRCVLMLHLTEVNLFPYQLMTTGSNVYLMMIFGVHPSAQSFFCSSEQRR